jgi:GAF domain-containing protein
MQEQQARLDDVITTPELERRVTRPPDHQSESEALVTLMRVLKEPGANVLQSVAETALALCGAHSAGISIAEHDGSEPVFRWHAAAGTWSKFRGQTVPRHASPCAVVLERNAPLLMTYPERCFTLPLAGAPPLAEVLLVPFTLAGETVGTVWVIAHDGHRKFDREDLRIMQRLSEVAALAFQISRQQQLKERPAATSFDCGIRC